MKLQKWVMISSIFLALLAIPLTLAAVKVNQDNRSQAMIESSPLPAIPPLNSPSPSPTPLK